MSPAPKPGHIIRYGHAGLGGLDLAADRRPSRATPNSRMEARLAKIPYTSSFHKVSDRRGDGYHYDYKDQETGAEMTIWVPEADPDKTKTAVEKIISDATRLNEFQKQNKT